MKPVEHHLKTWTHFFEDILRGKNFEIRKNDRDFQVGDILVLEDFCPQLKMAMGRSVRKLVTYVLLHEDFPKGIQEDYCIMGLKEGFEP